MNPRQCWYRGDDLYEDDNICEHDYYYPMYCCPSNENDVEKVSVRNPTSEYYYYLFKKIRWFQNIYIHMMVNRKLI